MSAKKLIINKDSLNQEILNISPDKFEIVGEKIEEQDKFYKENISFTKEAWLRFRKNKLAMIGLFILFILVLLAIIGPLLTPFDYATNNLVNKDQPPSLEHWFGTDDLGRDVFARAWNGARISLFIGIVAAAIDLVIGILWGGFSGYKGGNIDNFLMRIIDILYSLPYLLVVILLLVVLGQGLSTMIIAMTITGWIGMARIVRGQVLQLKNQEYVLASKALGADSKRIIFRHLIPNTLGPILVTLTLTIPGAIFTEAFLSYIGLGVPAPLASWGTMASDGVPAMIYYPWRLIVPAFLICLTLFSFNVVGDGLRDALDPRLRGK